MYLTRQKGTPSQICLPWVPDLRPRGRFQDRHFSGGGAILILVFDLMRPSISSHMEGGSIQMVRKNPVSVQGRGSLKQGNHTVLHKMQYKYNCEYNCITCYYKLEAANATAVVPVLLPGVLGGPRRYYEYYYQYYMELTFPRRDPEIMARFLQEECVNCNFQEKKYLNCQHLRKRVPYLTKKSNSENAMSIVLWHSTCRKYPGTHLCPTNILKGKMLNPGVGFLSHWPRPTGALSHVRQVSHRDQVHCSMIVPGTQRSICLTSVL